MRLISLTILCLTPLSALAHHSFAMFDTTKSVTLDATVKEFDWTNPHVTLMVLTNKDAALWSIELTSPGNLKRLGWTKHSLNPGDRIIVTIDPLRDGGHGGAFEKATNTATGQILTADFNALNK